MTTLKIIRELFSIGIGVACLIVALAFNGDAWLYLLSIGLICWGIYDIYAEVRDSSKSNEVGQLASERERIRRNLERRT